MADIIPKAATDYIKNKNLKVGFSYKDVWHEEHATGFTVAKAMQFDVLSDMHNAATKAVENGQSFETFKKNLKPTLQQKGWWGRKEMADPLTGKTVDAQLGSDRRLKTIYDTNMRKAFLYAKYKRIMDDPLMTHIMYISSKSSVHPRPIHQQWDGLILPKDDPWWGLHLPLKEFGCKCDFQGVSEFRKRKYEEEGIPTPKRIDGSGGGVIPVKTEAPPEVYRTYYNERKGTMERVPQGVHPSFNWDTRGESRNTGANKVLEESQQKYNETVKHVVPYLSEKHKISDMQRIHSDYIKKLTANEINNLGIYTSGKGTEINREIYKLDKNWEESKLAPVIKTLDGVIDNAPRLTEETFFFKGDDAIQWKNAKVGSIIPIKGFFSTAIQKSIAERYATEKLNNGKNPIMIVIRTPAGTKGLYIGETTEYHKGNEFEYLFPRGAKFRILEKDVGHVTIEAVNDH